MRILLTPPTIFAHPGCRAHLVATIALTRDALGAARAERVTRDEESVTVSLEIASLRSLCGLMLESLWSESGAEGEFKL